MACQHAPLFLEVVGVDTGALDIAALQEQLRHFAQAREWEQFHSPKNLAMALAGESGELLEIFQWLTEAESFDLSSDDLERTKEELSDIQIYLLRLADILGISIPSAVQAKMEGNESRYPVEKARGSAMKYSRRDAR
jgi:dCTP diphosphatase